jgi:serine phosphatase RsbU (regulator of sigma subunit)
MPDKRKTYSYVAFALVVALMMTIAGLYFYNIIRWTDYPNFGMGFRTATGIKEIGLVNEHGSKAGLQVGDRIISINNQTYNNFKELRKIINWELGEDNIFLIDRKGRTFAVTINNVPIGFKRAFSESGWSFLLSICYITIGILVFLMQPHNRTNWVFFLFTATFGMLLMFIYKIGVMKPFRLLESINTYGYIFTPAVFIQLAFCFPEERKILKKFPYAQYIPYLISLALYIRIWTLTPTMTDAPKSWLILAVAYMAVGVLTFIGSCIQLRLKSASVIVKLRARMVLLGFAIAASLPLVDFVCNTIFHVILAPSFNYYLPFFIVFPAFLGYSIVKHDLFDIDAIIKRTYGYVLTTGAIAGVYGLFVLLSNLAFGGFEFARSPLFTLLFILIIVFLFNPIRNRVQKLIDRLFYRLEYDYQTTVQKISESMRTLLGLDEIGKNIIDTAMGAMFIDSGYVMLRRKEEDAYHCLIHAGEKDQKIAQSDAQAAQLHTAGQPANGTTEAGTASEIETVNREEEGSDLIVGVDIGDQKGFSELNLNAEDPLIKKLSEYQKEVTVYDIQENPFFEDERNQCLRVFDQLDATLIVPLIYEEKLTGIISLGRKKSGKFYGQEDINLLNILANHGAVAIENALMLEEVIEKERMEEELNIARDLQVSMLPLECPQIKGYEIAAFSESAREVGGDFYDFIEISDDKLGIVIGDVTGKSVSGALVMSASRSIFRMLGEEKLTVSESMIRANRRTKKDIKTGMFVALLYVVLDSNEKKLSLCSAGQTQPIYRSAVSNETTLVETEGDTFPLGILDEANYEETELRLKPGDIAVLYTDGIVEAMNAQEEMFGFDRLIEAIKESKTLTAQSLLDEIKGQVSEFTAGAPQHDDITIIVLQAV